MITKNDPRWIGVKVYAGFFLVIAVFVFLTSLSRFSVPSALGHAIRIAWIWAAITSGVVLAVVVTVRTVKKRDKR